MSTVLSTVDGLAWQRSWDRQQEVFMPDREQRFGAMLDAVEAVAARLDRPPRVLDLAGGTGSISLRLLRRLPAAEITLLDLDPVLLHIARTTLPAGVRVAVADLREPDWFRAVPAAGFDAILTATALHWLAADRLAALYRDLHRLLARGGLFVNADHMPDEGMPALNAALGEADRRRREAWYAAAVALSWEGWWEHVTADPTLGPLKAQRDTLFGIDHSQEWTPGVTWHLSALRDAGFAETGLLWRGGRDAAVVGMR
jgi:SAM-dependent methyltransferase